MTDKLPQILTNKAPPHSDIQQIKQLLQQIQHQPIQASLQQNDHRFALHLNNPQASSNSLLLPFNTTQNSASLIALLQNIQLPVSLNLIIEIRHNQIYFSFAPSNHSQKNTGQTPPQPQIIQQKAFLQWFSQPFPVGLFQKQSSSTNTSQIHLQQNHQHTSSSSTHINPHSATALSNTTQSNTTQSGQRNKTTTSPPLSTSASGKNAVSSLPNQNTVKDQQQHNATNTRQPLLNNASSETSLQKNNVATHQQVSSSNTEKQTIHHHIQAKSDSSVHQSLSKPVKHSPHSEQILRTQSEKNKTQNNNPQVIGKQLIKNNLPKQQPITSLLHNLKELNTLVIHHKNTVNTNNSSKETQALLLFLNQLTQKIPSIDTFLQKPLKQIFLSSGLWSESQLQAHLKNNLSEYQNDWKQNLLQLKKILSEPSLFSQNKKNINNHVSSLNNNHKNTSTSSKETNSSKEINLSKNNLSSENPKNNAHTLSKKNNEPLSKIDTPTPKIHTPLNQQASSETSLLEKKSSAQSQKPLINTTQQTSTVEKQNNEQTMTSEPSLSAKNHKKITLPFTSSSNTAHISSKTPGTISVQNNTSTEPGTIESQKTQPPIKSSILPSNTLLDTSKPATQKETSSNVLQQIITEEWFQKTLEKTEAALSRIRYIQGQNLSQDSNQQAFWLMELPFQNKESIDLLQFKIQQDSKSQQKHKKNNWTITIRFEFESLGPIKAITQLRKDVFDVRFIAEKKATQQLIQNHLPELKNSLSQIGIDVEHMESQRGLAPDLIESQSNEQLVDFRI